MGQARRWASIVLSGLVAACLSAAAPGPARGAQEVLDWHVEGAIEAGGIYSFGERSSNKFNEYRDMDNGFAGEISLKAEKKSSPYYFEFQMKNPARDDQAYEGAIGRYGMFQLELGWDRVRHVLSNDAGTIFQESGGVFTLPATLRNTITTTPAGFLNNTAANCVGITSWTCPNPVGNTGAGALAGVRPGGAQYNFIAGTINGLLRPVDLGFNTDVGLVELKVSPTESLHFSVEYSNRKRDGYRAAGSNFTQVVELAVPIDDMTHEVKAMAEFARPDYAIQFGYTGSIFNNQYRSYIYDNPMSTVSQSYVAGTRSFALARGEFSAPPENTAHTFNLTGTAALPLRTRINGTFAYTMLRQDETFINNIPVTGTGLTQTNADSLGRTSPDAQANLVLGNILLTSRPINNVTATARYRYFGYQNDTPVHDFPFGYWQAGATYASPTRMVSKQERYTRQSAGLDLGWRPFRQVSLKGGYEYEHWHRGDIDGQNFGTAENTLKASVDVTPVNWLLGRVTYAYGNRNLSNYGRDPLSGPLFYKFNYADRNRNRVDVLLQLSRWETFTPSLNFGFADDNFANSAFGLTDDRNWSAGTNLTWTPLSRLTLSADYTYERHDATQRSPGSNAALSHVNDYESTSKDEFHIFGVNATLDVIPKKLDINLGYAATIGYTTITASNLNPSFTTRAANWDRINNVLQTAKVIARYRFTENLSVRGGFAYERFNERNFARDPMQAFMGWYDLATFSTTVSASGVQSVYLGANTPNYESYTIAGFVRYEFN